MKTDDEVKPRPPLVLLTGFLGAGKTTTLNRVLGRQQRLRVGVIINELGRIDIDTRLIKSRAGDVMELAGGCVCHEVRVQSELWAAIDEVNRRSRPDVVLLETTGIAEPWSILSGLEALGDAAPAVAAGVVCVVDAEAGGGQLARHEEARAQVEAADRILLTKLDLAPARRSWRCTGSWRGATRPPSAPASPTATRAPPRWCPGCSTARRAGASRADRHAHAHGQLVVVAFTDTEPLLAEPLLAVIDAPGHGAGAREGLRPPGGRGRRGFLERAGRAHGAATGEPWGAEPPRTELVLIGDGLDDGAIRRQIWACRARARS